MHCAFAKISCCYMHATILIIVFGFVQEAFIGVEGSDNVVEVDFQKGAKQVGHNLIFHFNDTAGTASESIHT